MEIVQFGSLVYAPQYARDLDLLVLTEGEKDHGGYLDCLDILDLPFDVDVVVNKVGGKLKESLALYIIGSCRVLYGNGKHLAQMAGRFNPNFEEARAYLRGARVILEMARTSADKYDKDMHIRTAFNGLFHAARTASMAYLATEESRWGKIKRELPSPYKGQFEEFIKTLHPRYFYNGEYPEDFGAEFEGWHKEVEDFVKVVLACTAELLRQSIRPLYIVAEGNVASIRVCEALGYRFARVREFSCRGVLLLAKV